MWMTSHLGRDVQAIDILSEGRFATLDRKGQELIWGWFYGIVSLE